MTLYQAPSFASRNAFLALNVCTLIELFLEMSSSPALVPDIWYCHIFEIVDRAQINGRMSGVVKFIRWCMLSEISDASVVDFVSQQMDCCDAGSCLQPYAAE